MTLTTEIRDKLVTVGTARVTAALSRHGLHGQSIQNARPLSPLQPVMVGPAFSQAIDACPPGAVLLAASAGLTLVTRLMKRGVAGMVTSGAVRDSADIARLGFPIYHQCGDVALLPGDIVLGDRHGLVVIPAPLAEEIAEEALEAAAFEDFLAEQVNMGHGIYGLYPPTSERTLAEFATWRRLRGR
ncbi:MAG: ribonuclease activity regulator RraA [Solimonas sp.]